MTVIGVLALFVVGGFWIAAIIAAFCRMVDAFEDRGIVYGLVWVVIVSVIFGGPFAVAFSFEDADPNANRLCLSGHEAWLDIHHPPMLVGKMIVPSHETTEKRWVCTQWQDR